MLDLGSGQAMQEAALYIRVSLCFLPSRRYMFLRGRRLGCPRMRLLSTRRCMRVSSFFSSSPIAHVFPAAHRNGPSSRAAATLSSSDVPCTSMVPSSWDRQGAQRALARQLDSSSLRLAPRLLWEPGTASRKQCMGQQCRLLSFLCSCV